MTIRRPDNKEPSPDKGSKKKKESSDFQFPGSGGNIQRGLWLLLLGLLVWNGYNMLFNQNTPQVDLPYSTFINQVESKNVESVTIVGSELRGTFQEAISWRADAESPTAALEPGEGIPLYEEFTTTIPEMEDPELLPLLRANGVHISAETPGTPLLISILINSIPFLILVGLLVWSSRSMRQVQGGIFQFGKSKAERYSENTPTVTFGDIAGEEEAKLELTEVVDFLRHPEKYLALGAKIPRGILLVGPPGTGKTLLARAVAGEAGAPFYNISASEFVEMFVGVGASRVRDLFDRAKKDSPAIIFIDEIDAVGRRRGAGMGGGNDEREQTLNQILVELDGFEENANLIVIAATNRPDVLDPALLRPGRFDRQVTVGLPDREGRLGILRIHVRGKPLAPDVDLEILARATPGFSGADLANLANEAALHAARKGNKRILRANFDAALDKIMLGVERPRLMDPYERKVVAYHEAGHALIARLTPGTDPVHKVTIIPRGRALGVTYQLPVDDRLNYPRDYLLGRITILMGGRAAEEVAIGEITSGAQNDLQEAAKLARRMVTKWGMSEELGVLAIPSDDENPFLGYEMTQHRNIGEGLATQIDLATRKIVEEAHSRAAQLLTHHRTLLDSLTERLLEHETLTAEALAEIWTGTEEELLGAAPAS
ncbi:MAG: ATP-dependent metallopeptidase FtsH/Yme1/Tma family protein [Ardenticatenales bacterium]|nr:ATP-dependent metallopeptidase FtsH/Yme1/Tma family protein [Ardenticatenales bacterium]